LQGRYVFGDWGSFSGPSGRLFYLEQGNVVTELRIGLADRPLNLWLKGFGEDASGELYILGSRFLGPAGNTGKMMKLIPGPASIKSPISALAEYLKRRQRAADSNFKLSAGDCSVCFDR
jgi:hypothetical protein